MSRIARAASSAFFATSMMLVALPATAGTEQVLWNFKSAGTGNPLGRLLLHGADLYGTGSGFGDSANGQVFRLRQSGAKWAGKSIVTFNGTNGSEPYAGLLASSGTFYGTTALGAGSQCGSVFSVSRTGGAWQQSTIWSFAGGANDGCNPTSDLVMDSAGNLFGTTTGGGSGTPATCNGGCGTVFELSPQQGGGWTETILHSFQIDEGAGPRGGLLRDKAGNLFGTTSAGGGSGCLVGCGTVFELSPSGGGWNFSTIHTFQGTDGGMPWSVLIEGARGTLYGTSTTGGQFSSGTVFELTPSGTSWSEKVLYDFRGASDGATPQAALLLNKDGGLYGTAFGGGQPGCLENLGCGVVFALKNARGGWRETVLYSFSGGNDGGNPAAAILLDTSGNLYSTAYQGGTKGYGTVWEVTP